MTYPNRTLNFLLISILAHAILLIGLPRLKIATSGRSLMNLEITYQNIKIDKALREKLSGVAKKKEKRIGLSDNLTNPPPYSKISKIDSKPSAQKISTPMIKDKQALGLVKLPQASSPFMKNPAYLSYYEIIREKIKSVADLDSTLDKEGEVCLSFILESNGQLRALKIIDEKSINDQNLRQLAYGFIEKAAPFPPFPSNLNHPRLSFNVIVEFRISEN